MKADNKLNTKMQKHFIVLSFSTVFMILSEIYGELPAAPQQDQTLNDSLSETRPLPNPDYASSDSDCIEQEDPFLERQKKTNKRAYIAPILKVRLRDLNLGLTITLKISFKARKVQEKCPVCTRGFQMSKNTWLRCQKCRRLFHKSKKCSGDARFRDPYCCLFCEPAVVTIGPSVPGEMLLAESPPPIAASVPQAQGRAFTQDTARMEERIEDLKFSRSETQPYTEADGNCGLHAVLGTLVVMSQHFSIIFSFL